ncbi:Leucine rich repeat-containing protein [Pseudobutyrivibrio ruminis DSM 9787]|uniref:Leucine rich repeat-containing protein n=2 Tax=Pseudobutyrivibrio ruminis TaxID=46206 RepID=A0A285T6Z1_9FIRM|nr:Leucine rich repeat-containing protein [Pseudobutyrivibrio ruminis DSM 9787]
MGNAMVKKNKGLLKKIGCILISASILLTGWTFFGSSISIADSDTDFVTETPLEPSENEGEPSEEENTEELEVTEPSADAAVEEPTGEAAGNETVTLDPNTFETYSLSEDMLRSSLTSVNSDGVFTFTSDANTVSSADGYSNSTTITRIVDSDSCGANIGASSFVNCTALTNINISGTASIGDEAFMGCTSLKSATFGSVSSFSSTAFQECEALTELSITNPGTYYTYNNAIYNGTTLVFVAPGTESLTVKAGTTAIGKNAFYGSNVSSLKFEDASDMQSIDEQENWPLNKPLSVNAPNGQNTAVETYFDEYKETHKDSQISIVFSNEEVGTLTVIITEEASDGSFSEEVVYENKAEGAVIRPTTRAGYTCSETYTVTADDVQTHTFTYTPGGTTTGITVTITETASDNSFSETITYTDKAAGDVISPTTRTGYTCSDTYTVTSDTTQTHTFTYTVGESEGGGGGGSDAKKYSGTIMGNFYENDGKTAIGTRQVGSFSQAAGTTVSAPAVDGYTAFGTTTYKVTATDGQTATFNYKRNSSSSSGSTKKFKVTVYDEFYDQTMTKKIETKTRQTDTYAQGDTYSYEPKTYSGYEFVTAENQSGTVNQDRTVTFKYKATTASGKTTSNSKYSVIAGANQKVPSNVGTVTITCDGPLDKIVAIKVDGVTLAQNQFTVESGSTILTLTASYVASLSAGDHVVRFEYTDGWAETLLTITGKTTTTVTYKVGSDGSISSGHTKDTTPTTADGFDSRYLLCLAIFLLGAGTILFSKQKKLEAILAGERDDE